MFSSERHRLQHVKSLIEKYFRLAENPEQNRSVLLLTCLKSKSRYPNSCNLIRMSRVQQSGSTTTVAQYSSSVLYLESQISNLIGQAGDDEEYADAGADALVDADVDADVDVGAGIDADAGADAGVDADVGVDAGVDAFRRCRMSLMLSFPVLLSPVISP